MEHGEREANCVIPCEGVPEGEPEVSSHQVPVREHHPFWKTCGTPGVHENRHLILIHFYQRIGTGGGFEEFFIIGDPVAPSVQEYKVLDTLRLFNKVCPRSSNPSPTKKTVASQSLTM